MHNFKSLSSFMIFVAFFSGCSSFNQGVQNRQLKEANQKTSKPSTKMSYSPGNDSKTSKILVRKLEGALSSKKEIEQYSKALPWFESDQEKAEFLSLPDYEAKQTWLNEKEFSGRSKEVQSSMEDLVAAQDIAVGMPFNLVKKSWGEPDSIEVSGNPQFKNERWKYNKFISTQDGYKAEKKTVYFEGGKVVGWELE